jgi:4-amino-4-deoxy-L-arabinose transferase-like glycosyltransferase
MTPRHAKPIEEHRLLNACERVERRLENSLWPLLLGCAILISLSLAASSARPFWFDELFTFHLARLPDFATLWLALSKGTDLQPPLFHLTTAAAQKLFGSSEVATRLPALAGYLLMTVCIYLFVRRRTSGWYALIAALFPAVTEAFRYSYEARPYGLMMGFSALALLCWQQAVSATGVRRAIGLVGLWLSLSLALSFHYYSVLAFVAIGTGEAVRIVQRRRLDIPIAMAACLAGLIGIIYLPLIRGAVTVHSDHPWNGVSLRFVFDALHFALSPAAVPMAFCVVALGLLYGLPRVAQAPAARRIVLTLPETGACLGFVMLPLFGYLVGRFVTHMMSERYVLPLVIGFAVLFACALYQATGGRALAGLILAAILATVFVGRHIARPPMVNEFATLRLPAQDRDLPLVLASSLDVVPRLYYANADVTSRIVCVDLSTHYHGVDAVDRDVFIAAPFFHWPVMHYADFARAHPRFFLLATPASDWVAKRLRADGAELQLEPSPPDAALYLVTLGQ